MKKWKIGLSISILINVVLLVYIMFAHQSQSASLGHVDCVNSWNNMIMQMDYAADIVFFCDSHIAEGNFQKAFPSKKIINMGFIGENTKSMLRRIGALKSLSPNKVFIMAGVNGLKSQSLTDFYRSYKSLIDSIQSCLPNTCIYMGSIPPVASSSAFCNNEKIQEANSIIKRISLECLCNYVDIYSLYAENGALPISMTVDGLHLKPKAYPKWYDSIRYIME